MSTAAVRELVSGSIKPPLQFSVVLLLSPPKRLLGDLGHAESSEMRRYFIAMSWECKHVTATKQAVPTWWA